MDASAYHQLTPVQILRGSRGLLNRRLKEQRSTGKIIARDAHSLLVGTRNLREGTTRDARGLVVAHGDVLAALLVRR
jgi:hypothetical protein